MQHIFCAGGSRTSRCLGRREKGDGNLLCEAPFGPFRQKVPVPFFPPNSNARSRKGNIVPFMRRGWLAMWNAAIVAAVLHAQTPSRQDAPDQKPPAVRPEAPKPSTAQRGLDDLGIPANSVIVIYDDLQKALGALPKWVLLAPERFQELRKLELEAAQRQSNVLRLTVPTSCHLSGRVEGDVAHVQARFKIVTDKPRTLVALGCQRAWARSATLDGRVPLLVADPKEDGLFVQIEKPGEHALTLELAVPVANRGARGGERGFDLGLPRCAITNLEEFEIAGQHGEARLNRLPVRPRPQGLSSRIDKIPLGPADRFDLAWKSATAPNAQSPPLTSAEGHWTVRVEDKRIVTEVELQLQVLAGEVEQWRIHVPRGVSFELREPAPQDERIDRRELPAENSSVLVLSLKKPSSEPLRLLFQVQQPRKEIANSIGPFVVAGALRQSGAIGVIAPPELRIGYRTDDNTTPRDTSEDAARSLAASFAYWSLPSATIQADGSMAAPLQLDIQSLKGAVEAKVEHLLELTPAGWHAQTKMDFYPVRTGVDTIEIQVPENYPFDNARGVGPTELADPPVLDLKRRLATIKLAQKQTRPFSLTLTANYALPVEQRQIALTLPKPLHALDRGGRTVVVLPPEWELAARQGDVESSVPGPNRSHQYTRMWERTPDRIELSWRPYRPELRVESLLDVTLYASQASVRHRLDLQFPGRTPERVALQIPTALGERLRILQGGVLEDAGVVKLDHPESKAKLVLAYDVPLAKEAFDSLGERVLPFPFVRVRQATHAQTKARFWCDATGQLACAEGPWDEAPVEAAADRDSLPSLVLRGASLDGTLALRQRDGGRSGLAPLVIERALVQVVAASEGHHAYRARFLIARIGTRQLDVEFPAAVAGLNLAVYLDGKRINTVRSVDANGHPADGGTVARIAVEPELYRRPVILDVHYQLGPTRRQTGLALASVFYPPAFPVEALLGPVRWQLDLPGDSVFLYRAGNSDLEQTWTWRGGLLAPVARPDTRDLEQWLGTAPTATAPDEVATSAVCWRSSLEPVRVISVPQPAWLLTCSMLVLIVGLVPLKAPITRGVRAVAVGVIGLAILFATLAWPNVLATLLYGSEPGLGVLVVVLLGNRLGRSWEQRRSQYLPGFTRARNGSASKSGSSLNKKREPSTVDAPVARGSSVLRQPQSQGP